MISTWKKFCPDKAETSGSINAAGAEKISAPDAVLLAAGGSTRFGGNKLFFPVNGKPMYRSVLDRLFLLQEKGMIRWIVIVTGSDALRLTVLPGEGRLDTLVNTLPPDSEREAGCTDDDGAVFMDAAGQAAVVMNRRYEAGISRSIKLGLLALQRVHPESQSCLFSVADQPYISVNSLEKLIRCHLSSEKNITAAAADKTLGNPVIFSKKYYEELCALTGDRGGKKIVLRHPEDTEAVEVPEKELADFDTAQAVMENGLAGGGANAGGGQLWLAGNLKAVPPEEAFPFLNRRSGVISLVGAGGKTSLLYFLAKLLAEKGKKVLVTTSTHIWKPDEKVYARSVKEAEALWKRASYAVIGEETGSRENGPQKLASPDPKLLRTCMDKADFTLIEADGSRQMPFKVPGEQEPVIWPETDTLIGVMGLSAVGEKLSDVCFRAERIRNARDADILTPMLAASVLSSKRGTRKGAGNREYYIVLNQCDDPPARSKAEEISVLLKTLEAEKQGQECPASVVFSALRPSQGRG